MSFDYHLWLTWGLGFTVTTYQSCDERMTVIWESAQVKIIIGPLLLNITFPVSSRKPYLP